MSMSEKSVAFCVDNLLGRERCGVRVELCLQRLWARFCEVGTEMIVNKAGSRRMYPPIRVKISGLDKDKLYSVHLELVSAEDRRYRFDRARERWLATEAKQTASEASGLASHPSNPALGEKWIRLGTVSFDRVKLTNRNESRMRDHLFLNTMRKYVAKIHVTEDSAECVSFTFPETTFVAVTAYQNSKIAKLKCGHNPFATGIRSGSNRVIRYAEPSVRPEYNWSIKRNRTNTRDAENEKKYHLGEHNASRELSGRRRDNGDSIRTILPGVDFLTHLLFPE